MGPAQKALQTGKPQTPSHNVCNSFCARRTHCLLAKVNPETCLRLEQDIGHARVLQRGQRLFTCGETCSSLYLISSGSFKAYVDSNSGEQQITGFHFNNDVLGFDGLENGRHTYSAEALETASVCRISLVTLHELIGRDPQLHQQLLKKASRQINNEHMTIFMLGRMSAEQRLAQFFLTLSAVMQESGCAADRINLSMARNDIANYLGLAVETVSRLLKRFQSAGLLKVLQRKIELRDSAGLREIAHRDDEKSGRQQARSLMQENQARQVLSYLQ
jgi:CRP/FNR family transcriptional regulator